MRTYLSLVNLLLTMTTRYNNNVCMYVVNLVVVNSDSGKRQEKEEKVMMLRVYVTANSYEQ